MLGKFFDIYNRFLLYYCDVYCWWFLIYWNYVLILSFFFLIFFIRGFFCEVFNCSWLFWYNRGSGWRDREGEGSYVWFFCVCKW